MSRLLLIDGFNLAYRCFFATPALSRSDGFPTNALHGWVKSLWRLIDLEKPDETVVFFDLGGSKDRLALHADYKAQREEMPEPLARQIPYLKKFTELLGLGCVEEDGVESDDLLASYAVTRAARGDTVSIVSSDKDFAQIVGNNIRILLPPPSAQPKLGWSVLDAEGVKAKFGVPPERIVDYLSLIGDSSDNIPGVPGVGPKTASKWIEQHGSIEGILAAAGEIKPDRFRPLLLLEREKLLLNRRLITLNLGLPVTPRGPARVNIDELIALFRQMEMKNTQEEALRRYTQAELF